jgi:hypothetical protein
MRMRGRENSTNVRFVVASVVAFAMTPAVGCKRRMEAPAPAVPAVSTATRSASAAALLVDVVDPWSWPRAQMPEHLSSLQQQRLDRAKTIEDIGPYERQRPGDRTSPLINPNGHYWTALAGIAWDRDVAIDFDDEPVDLDGDGSPDTRVTRHVHAKGGVLANPELFGLTRTPDDPRGTTGLISVSTGVLGLREPLDESGKPTGQIGMTCWLCHGAANPVDGARVLGLPGVAFDYGLLLATASVLDDDNAEAVAHRKAHRFPAGRTVRARLLLAGPGRQDLTGEFGLDVTVPGYRSARYPGTARVRQGTRGIVNPISVPTILAAPGLALENWSGSEEADAPWLDRLLAVVGRADALAPTGLGLAPPGGPSEPDPATLRRNLLFDLRNLGTLGLQQDSFPGLLWADAVYGHASLPRGEMLAIPSMYAAAPIRRTLAVAHNGFARPTRNAAQVARGRAIFAETFVGTIANRQVLKRAPAAYAAAKLEGPVLVPIDPTQPLEARLRVRCADCHSAAPLDAKLPLADNPPPLGRCSHCHVAHPAPSPLDGANAKAPATDERVLVAIAAPLAARRPTAEVTLCGGCHESHRAFGPLVYSSSRLFPFDADGNGDAQLDPGGDARAGGIGTEPLLAFDVPRPQWPFAVELPVITDPKKAGRVTRAHVGVSWVRVAPLTGVFATGPYLHNGSVPTLSALLEPAARRPKTFALGKAGFVFDTRLAGNGNAGHEFGTALSAREKADLIAFLETL